MEQVGPALSVTDHESVRRWTMQLAPAVVLDSGLKVFSASGTARAR
jgi:hypothetical protein